MAQLVDYRDRMIALAKTAMGAATPAQVEAVDKVAADAKTEATKALNAAMASRIDLGAVEIKFRSILAVSLGVRVVTIAVKDAKVGDRVYIHQTSAWAAGYAVLGNGYVPTAGNVELRLLTPAVSLVSDVSLAAQLIGYRAP